MPLNTKSNFIILISFILINICANAQSDKYYKIVIEKFPTAKKLENSNLLYDFKKPFFGQVSFNVEKLQKGDSLVVVLGEKLDTYGRIDRKPGGNIRANQYVFIKKDSNQHSVVFPNVANAKNTSGNAIKLPNEMGIVLPFRFVEVIQPENEIKPNSRKYFHYPFDDAAADFNSSDSILNAIWSLCKHTVKATSFAGYYIDGDRERIPYEADALINQLSHYAVDTGYGLARNTIEYLMLHPTWPTEWHLQMHQVVYNDFLFTGNIELIKKYYDLLKLKTLSAFKQSNGLISTTVSPQRLTFLDSINYKTFDAKAGLRDITDWPQRGNNVAGPTYIGESDGFVFCPYNSVVNAFHYKSVMLMKTFAKLLKYENDVKLFDQESKTLYNNFQKIFVGKNGLVKDGDTTSHCSQHANFFALAFGLIEPVNKNNVIEHIKSKGMACSVYGSQFLLDALFEAEAADAALDLMVSKSERSWYHMLEVGAGMTTEAWDIKFKPNQDWNHAWGSAPGNVIAFKLMGIYPESPAFETVSIKPQIGRLKYASIIIPTLKGSIKEKISQNKKTYKISIDIPRGVRSNVTLPIFSEQSKLNIISKYKYQYIKSNKKFLINGVKGHVEVIIEK